MEKHPDVEAVLLSPDQIAAKVGELGRRISSDYAGKELLLIAVLRGSIVFLADLLRNIVGSVVLDFVSLSSYRQSTESSGHICLVKDMEEDVKGRHILIVEDIVDTGLTLHWLTEHLRAQEAASVKVCAFLDKPSRRKVLLHLDYKGFQVPDAFVVGYGLDYAQHYRNLPYVGVLRPEVYGRKARGT